MSSIQNFDGFREADVPPLGPAWLPSGQGEQALSDKEIERVLLVTGLSLAAFHLNHCRFVVVRDPGLRTRVQQVTTQIPSPAMSASLIILCVELPARQSASAALSSQGGREDDPLVANPPGHPSQAWEEAMVNCGIAAQTLMLTAKAMGYECQRLMGVDTRGLGRFINLPANYVAAMLLAVGKQLAPTVHRFTDLPFQELVVFDRF